MTYSDPQGQKYSVEVSADQQRVTVHVPAGSQAGAKAVLQKLAELNIRHVDEATVTEQLGASRKAGLTVTAAQGVLPRDEGPPELVLRVPATEPASGTFTRVRRGQVLADITEPAPGADGHDVFGRPIEHARNTVTIEPGPNTSIIDGKLLAGVDGLMHLSHKSISVTPVTDIDGSDPASASVQQCDGDVFVRGNFPDGRLLLANGAMVVGGAIEAVELEVGRFVYAKGGIVGRGKGRYQVGGDLRCRFITNATVFCRGDVHVLSEVSNTSLACFGRLHVTAGAIFGGSVVATGGVSCRIAGNSAGRPTVIEAGTDTPAIQLNHDVMARIEANRARIRDVRQKIQPLMARVKALTPAQKERATELLFEADEMEAVTNEMEQKVAKLLSDAATAAKAEVLISEAAYPGVTVVFPGVSTLLRKPISGPCRIIAKSRHQIVLVDDVRRTVLPLDSVQQGPQGPAVTLRAG